MLQQNVLAKSSDNFKLSTVLPFVEFYTTMALVILTEQRFCWWRCGCETTQALRLRSLVWRRVDRQTRYKIPTGRNWKRTRYGAVAVCIDLAGTGGEVFSDTKYWSCLQNITAVSPRTNVVALTASLWLHDVLTVEIYDILPMVKTVLHLTSHLF